MDLPQHWRRKRTRLLLFLLCNSCSWTSLGFLVLQIPFFRVFAKPGMGMVQSSESTIWREKLEFEDMLFTCVLDKATRWAWYCCSNLCSLGIFYGMMWIDFSGCSALWTREFLNLPPRFSGTMLGADRSRIWLFGRSDRKTLPPLIS